MSRAHFQVVWSLVGVSFLLSGCGYSLAGKGDFLPAHITTIGIPTFENLTDRHGIEETFTQKVVEEFASRGKYVIRPEEVGVDAVLSGQVTAFQVVPAVLVSGENVTADQAARYTVVIRASVVFMDMVENEEIWSDASFSFRDEYEVGEDAEQYFDQEGMALDRLAEEFAKTLVSRILEAF